MTLSELRKIAEAAKDELDQDVVMHPEVILALLDEIELCRKYAVFYANTDAREQWMQARARVDEILKGV